VNQKFFAVTQCGRARPPENLMRIKQTGGIQTDFAHGAAEAEATVRGPGRAGGDAEEFFPGRGDGARRVGAEAGERGILNKD